VVALVHGAETTLKRFYVEGSVVRLQPANIEMDPIYVPAAQVAIQGRVLGFCESTTRLGRISYLAKETASSPSQISLARLNPEPSRYSFRSACSGNGRFQHSPPCQRIAVAPRLDAFLRDREVPSLARLHNPVEASKSAIVRSLQSSTWPAVGGFRGHRIAVNGQSSGGRNNRRFRSDGHPSHQGRRAQFILYNGLNGYVMHRRRS